MASKQLATFFQSDNSASHCAIMVMPAYEGGKAIIVVAVLNSFGTHAEWTAKKAIADEKATQEENISHALLHGERLSKADAIGIFEDFGRSDAKYLP